MELIEITNLEQVRNCAIEVESNVTKIDSARNSIDYILRELDGYWEAEGLDAQSFSAGLKEEVKYLELMVECNKEFAKAMIDYVDATKKTAERSVNV